MVDTFRSRLADELAEAGEPPLGDLVDGAIAQGQRLVVRRRLRIAAAALSVTVVMGLTGAGLALTGRHDPGGALPAAEASDGTRVEATPEGLLELLLRLLPDGTTGEYAGIRDRDRGAVQVQTYLVRDRGAGLVRLTVDHGGFVPPASRRDTPTAPPPRRVPPCVNANNVPCEETSGQGDVTWSDGKTYQVTTDDLDCSRSARITVLHPEQVRVTIEIDTCPARTRAEGGAPVLVPPGAPPGLPLTPAEAVELGGDPRWGPAIDARLAEAGERRFPNLARPGRR